MRPGSRFSPLALASLMRAPKIIRSSYYGFPERDPGHSDFSAAHTHGVELADVIQTESRRLCNLRSGFNVSDALHSRRRQPHRKTYPCLVVFS